MVRRAKEWKGFAFFIRRPLPLLVAMTIQHPTNYRHVVRTLVRV